MKSKTRRLVYVLAAVAAFTLSVQKKPLNSFKAADKIQGPFDVSVYLVPTAEASAKCTSNTFGTGSGCLEICCTIAGKVMCTTYGACS